MKLAAEFRYRGSEHESMEHGTISGGLLLIVFSITSFERSALYMA
jgi:hypothetical protein